MSQKTHEMKPYKKRSFFNHVQTNSNVMEVEIGEEQVTSSPPSEDGEKEKDKYGEPKCRKKWKRKISRKQFRHHDIKLFTPGEFRTSTFLKPKDSPSGLAPKAESMPESVVTCLGGQRLSPSDKSRVEDIEDVTRKNDVEENNNSNTAQNNNSVGKHNLPAIILGTPSARRRSVDSTNQVKAPVFKYPEKLTNDHLLIKSTIEEIREQVHQIEKLNQAKQEENGFPKEDERRRHNKPVIERAAPTETNEAYEQPQNLSLKSNYPVEVPVDLSKKTSPPRYFTPDRKLVSVSTNHYQQDYHKDGVIRSSIFATPEYHLYENLTRLNKLLFAWKEILQRFINQGFSLDYLGIVAQAYVGIEKEVKGGHLSIDQTIKCQQLLADSYGTLKKELALLNPDLDPRNVLGVYAHPEGKGKQKLHDYLKDLWLKSVYRSPTQSPLHNYRDLNSPSTPCFSEEQSTATVNQLHNAEFLVEQNQFLGQGMQMSNLVKIGGTPLGRPRSKSHKVLEPRNEPPPLRRTISTPTNEKYHKSYSYPDNSMGSPTNVPVGKKSLAHLHSTKLSSNPIKIHNSASLHLGNTFTLSKSPMPNINRLTITDASKTPEKNPADSYRPTTLVHQLSPVEDKISSTTDFLQVEKLSKNSTRNFYKKMSAPTPKVRDDQAKIPPRVIVVDNSMQITKEIHQAERRMSQPSLNESDRSSPARIEHISSSEENLRQAFANDQEENTEFLEWLERLNKDEKLKSRFLSKMGINNRKGVTGCDTIEIVDSDDEETIKIKPVASSEPTHPYSLMKTTSKPKSTSPISPIKDPFHAPKTPTQKTIYSPKIEPISPVSNEPTFAFPKVTIRSTKMETVTSPSYQAKRKTPPIFHGEKVPSTTLNGSSKRRKSLDRPNTSTSPRLAPSGKLCYVRDNCMFLRYYDDTQVELFIKNLSTPDEELLRTTGIDPQKLKTTYKPPGNFALDQLRTEIIHLPRDVEFSRKEELTEVEEFVQESKLVEKYVPQDFAKFYRYVTGFQIIKNKHPVSLQTFLTMYNTNRTTELLRKYLERIDEDSFGA